MVTLKGNSLRQKKKEADEREEEFLTNFQLEILGKHSELRYEGLLLWTNLST